MKRNLLTILIITSGVFGAGLIGADDVYSTEGESVTLRCSLRQSGSLRWYKQYPNRALQYLDYTADLTVSNPTLADTALYYCALRVGAHQCCTTMIISTVLLLSALTGLRAEDLITPNRDAVFTGEGQTVTLSCNYSGTAYSLHWYRQYSGSPPQFLILDYSGVITEAQPPVPGISISHVKEQKTVELKISSAAVSDSALYYCALQPTVTGNPDTLCRNWFYD
ncbi:hypothetical protein NFI96_029213 [Prochilodus magdalenae]|nr:hypothetical protein NFI96_029213 [Prochilodus magdalenae]